MRIPAPPPPSDPRRDPGRAIREGGWKTQAPVTLSDSDPVEIAPGRTITFKEFRESGLEFAESGWPPMPKPFPPPPEPPRPTHAQAFDAPAAYTAAQELVSQRWQERVVLRIAEEIERDLRDGGPTPVPSHERAALAMIRTVALELEDAARALDEAAAHLKSDGGKGFRASQAKQAALKARRAAHGLIGESR